MSPNISIIRLIGSMIAILLPVGLSAQEDSTEQNREQLLINDINRLGERAVRDNVISEDERKDIMGFVRDSLPESTNLKIRALEQIRNELDNQYEEMIRNADKLLEDAGFIGNHMLPEILYTPDEYVSPEEKRRQIEQAAISAAGRNMKEILKSVKPLPMNPWLRTILRLLFGGSVNQRPERWDQSVVPQMGGLYNITLPGRIPDYEWQDAPKMEYDPHPDKHFRR